jgi:nucleoside-diphosphate-sugar epimerase
MEFVEWDVREVAPEKLRATHWDWIFNFAAVHREPGHEREEYFDTNVPGARHVCSLAEATGCPAILFTSSIAVYGPTRGATDEESPKYPTTGYGISKLLAEEIHQGWVSRSLKTEVSGELNTGSFLPNNKSVKRLVICRPGVVYGPGEQGNIRRMVQAIRSGLFFFPGDRKILKSYAYIEGLLDSFEFMMRDKSGASATASPEPRASCSTDGTQSIIYNYVESPTEPLEALAGHIAKEMGKRQRFLSVPLGLLVLAAAVVQILTRGKSGLHPARVRKAATPTEIVPSGLLSRGFVFKYNFAASLIDWKSKEPRLWVGRNSE